MKTCDFRGLRVVVLSGLAGLFLVTASARAEEGWLKKGAQRKVRVFTGEGEKKAADQKVDRRGKVVIRRIKPQCNSDWNNDHTALPFLFYQLSLRTKGEFPNYVNNAGLELLDDEMFEYPIIYFTSHLAFSFSDDEVKNLRKYVERGGTLWLDDCVGCGPFMECVPQNVQRIVPGAEMKIMLQSDPEFDGLFDMMYSLGYPDLEKEQFNRPFQVAYVRGRPAIIFCPNDYGCRWEISTPPTALNPLGEGAHGMAGDTKRESVYQFSINWLFYTLTH